MPVFFMKAGKKLSLEAWLSIQHVLTEQEAKVFAYIQAAGQGGIANHQIVEVSGMGIQSVTARVTGLQDKGVIVASGQYVKTPSGRRANLWIVK